jgi:hypothetical protein
MLCCLVFLTGTVTPFTVASFVQLTNVIEVRNPTRRRVDALFASGGTGFVPGEVN